MIKIRGAREHNLRNIDIDLPRDRLIVVTGLSGSGKSSLAFDTIYAEGQRRYVESLSAYARQFLELMEKPDVDTIEGLSPAISIEQKTTSRNPRSTVGTVTEIYDYMRLLFARVGIPYSPATGLPIESQTVSQMVDRVMAMEEGTRLYLLAPIVRGRKGEYRKEFADLQKSFMDQLDVDEEVASILVQEGFSSVEEIAYVPVNEMTAVEEFDEDIVEELRNRARDVLLMQAIASEEKLDEVEPAEDLLEMEGMDRETAFLLASNEIVTREDLAEQAVDDLLEIEGMEKERAASLIMTARQIWFTEEELQQG